MWTDWKTFWQKNEGPAMGKAEKEIKIVAVPILLAILLILLILLFCNFVFEKETKIVAVVLSH